MDIKPLVRFLVLLIMSFCIHPQLPSWLQASLCNISLSNWCDENVGWRMVWVGTVICSRWGIMAKDWIGYDLCGVSWRWGQDPRDLDTIYIDTQITYRKLFNHVLIRGNHLFLFQIDWNVMFCHKLSCRVVHRDGDMGSAIGGTHVNRTASVRTRWLYAHLIIAEWKSSLLYIFSCFLW
jgi:hypothetical protein